MSFLFQHQFALSYYINKNPAVVRGVCKVKLVITYSYSIHAPFWLYPLSG